MFLEPPGVDLTFLIVSTQLMLIQWSFTRHSWGNAMVPGQEKQMKNYDRSLIFWGAKSSHEMTLHSHAMFLKVFLNPELIGQKKKFDVPLNFL